MTLWKHFDLEVAIEKEVSCRNLKYFMNHDYTSTYSGVKETNRYTCGNGSENDKRDF